MKKGDKVRNTGAVTQEARERVGEIVLVKVPGMSDCALVRFDPTSDRLLSAAPPARGNQMRTAYRWSAKALKKLGDKVGADERLVFTGPRSALLYQAGEVLATGLRKSRDSFVTRTDETVPVEMEYDPKLDQAPTSREELPKLVAQFGLKERKRATPTASEMKLKEKAT